MEPSKNWNMPVEEVEISGISPDNISEFYEKVLQKKREILEKGHTEVRLFISEPVQAATITSNFLSNWMPVKLYHKSQGGQTYEYWSPLVKG